MKRSPYNYQDSYYNEYQRREGILNQWIKVMGNCGKLLLVGMDWIIVLVEEQAHKLPRKVLPFLRVYKNEQIEHKAISDYVRDCGEREPLIDVDSNLTNSKNSTVNIPKNGHSRLKDGMPIYCETP